MHVKQSIQYPVFYAEGEFLNRLPSHPRCFYSDFFFTQEKCLVHFFSIMTQILARLNRKSKEPILCMPGFPSVLKFAVSVDANK